MRVLSYNVWASPGAPYVKERLTALIPELLGYDLVCLQEMTDDCSLSSKSFLCDVKIKQRFPHTFQCRTNAVGNGLLLLSRFPFDRLPIFHQYHVHGHPEEASLDKAFLTHRGVTLARVVVPASIFGNTNSSSKDEELIVINVYNTHIIPLFEPRRKSQPEERYASLRMSQISQLGQFVASTAPKRSDRIVLCGDFGCGSNSPEGHLLKSLVERSSSLTGERQVLISATLNDGHEWLNHTHHSLWQKSHAKERGGQRSLIFVSSGTLRCQETTLALTACSLSTSLGKRPLSSYFGVATCLELGCCETEQRASTHTSGELDYHIRSAAEVSQRGAKKYREEQMWYNKRTLGCFVVAAFIPLLSQTGIGLLKVAAGWSQGDTATAEPDGSDDLVGAGLQFLLEGMLSLLLGVLGGYFCLNGVFVRWQYSYVLKYQAKELHRLARKSSWNTHEVSASAEVEGE